MSPDTLFEASNTLALAGWLALLLTPVAPREVSREYMPG